MTGGDAFDISLKIVLVGESGVGKTTICNSLAHRGNERTLSTIGVDFLSKIMTIRDKRVLLQVWDTAGQEQFASLPSYYLRDSHAVCIVYAVDDHDSYTKVRTRWKPAIDATVPGVPVFVIANKMDLPVKVVDEKGAREDAKLFRWYYYTCYGKDRAKVDGLFDAIAVIASGLANKAPSPRSVEEAKQVLKLSGATAVLPTVTSPADATNTTTTVNQTCYC